MKVIAAVLCLCAAVNAAAVLPLESSVVKSDRVGDNFSYSIHQNQGYAALTSDVTAIKPVVPAATYVSPLEVKATEYKHVLPVTPVEYKATEYKQVVPITPIQLKSTEYKQVVPVTPIQYKSTEYKHVLPATTIVAADPFKNVELKSIVQPTYVASPYVASPYKNYELKSIVQPATVVASPVKSLSYVHQPSTAYVGPQITYTHDAAVPYTYGTNLYTYPYTAYSYPYINSEIKY